MRALRAVPIIALVLALGSLASAGVALSQRHTYTRGWENAATSAPPLPLRLPRPGVNVELTQYEPAELAAQLADMAGLGVTWVRQTFPWAAIEPEPGVYHWERWDALVEAVAAVPGLQLVAVLNLSPTWARHALAPDSETAPPASNADFARFARLLAERYGEVIDYYQVWDEPNLTAAWGGLDPKAADYVALLQAAYTAIHAVDEEATVITAGLAPTVETGPRNYGEVLFLRAIYENGGRDYFDAVAGKPYGFDTGPEDRRVDEAVLNFSRLILLREEMVRQGDSHKAVWASHFGWNALPEGWDGQPSIWGQVSRGQQLAYTQAAYERAEREWPWLGGLILQHWQPDAPGTDPLWGFSLIPPGEQRIHEHELDGLFGRGRGLAAGPGRHHPVSPFATYRGEWEFGELGADFGQRGDSEASFVFEGTDAALELRRDNYRGYLYVTVDGEPTDALPRDSEGRSYIILTSEDLAPHVDVIPVIQGLAAGAHVLHLRAERGWDQWTLAAFRVGVSPDTAVYDQAIAISAVVLVVSTAALAVTGRNRMQALKWPLPLWLHRMSRAWQMALGGAASVLLMIGMLLTWQSAVPALLRRDPPGLLLGLLTAGVLYFSPSLVLAVMAALVLWLLIYHRLELGLLLTLVWSPFFLFPLELYRFAFSMAEVTLLLTATAWILQSLIRWARHYRESAPEKQQSIPQVLSQRLHRLTALDWGMAVLLGLALLSISWSAHRVEAWREWRTVILEPVLFYAIARTTIRTRDEVVRLVDAFVFSATLTAALGVGMYLSGQGVITTEAGVRRLAGVYGSPNNVGLLMDRAVPFALAYALLPLGHARRILAGLAGALMLAATALSQSLGAILLGLPAGVAAVLVLRYGRRAVTALAVAGAAGLAALVPLSQHPRFADVFDFSGGTSFFRLRLWQSAVQMIRDRPIRGLGLDQFLYQYRGRYILPEAWQEPNLSHPHNILLDFWTRLGLGGVLLLIGFQVAFWAKATRAARLVKEVPVLRAVSMGAMGSMAALLAHGLVDNSVFVQDLSYVFALLIALPGLLCAVRAAAVDAGI